MLGIPREVAEDTAQRMLRALRVRGPDDEGSVLVADPAQKAPPALLLQTRLAVQDPSPAGHQPMADEQLSDRLTNWIVYNGEVYNHRELRDSLGECEHRWRSNSDTEVILAAFRAWGEECVTRMRGMFAWCLLDSRRGCAWFCRDRLGIKPLYLFRPRSGGLLFASEVRTLLAAGAHLVPREINPAAVESFLAQGAVCGYESIVRGIQLLPPGHSLTTDWSGRTLRTRTYWRLGFPPATERPPLVDSGVLSTEARRIGEKLREVYRIHLQADLPVGLFLSGGIDSAAAATVAAELCGNGLPTLCLGFDSASHDESAAAAAVARELGADHRSTRLSGNEVVRDLGRVLAAADQPTVDGFNTYFVARAAREAGLKVAVTGLGGDELFGGYASFRDVPAALRWRRRLGWSRLGRDGTRFLAKLSHARGSTKAAEVFERPPTPLQMYFLRRELFLPWQRRRLLRLPDESNPYSGVPQTLMEELERYSPSLDLINQVSYFELASYMRNMLLRDADVFSLAHGLELRVPMLDHKLVDHVTALPGAWKRSRRPPKALLVNAVGPRLPRASYTRPKRGFSLPWGDWLRGSMQKQARDTLESSEIWRRLHVNPVVPSSFWRKFSRGDGRLGALHVLALMVLADYVVRHDLKAAA